MEAQQELAFDVVPTYAMVARVPGKVPGTVIIIEDVGYTVRISEYSDPRTVVRLWEYRTMPEAIKALAVYLSTAADEPSYWLRAVDLDGSGFARMRRGQMLDGEWMVREVPAQ